MSTRRKTAFAISRQPSALLDETLLVLGAVIAAMLALALPALADESYVCEGGRIVTVGFGELEKVARTDPCIARYLANRPSVMSPQAAAMEAANEVDMPLPARKPAAALANTSANAVSANAAASASAPDAATRHAPAEVIVHYEAPPTGESEVLRPRVEQIAFRRAPHHFYSNEALPQGPVDFRNVPILNATEGEPGIFHHTR